jgi:hypothetical protein
MERDPNLVRMMLEHLNATMAFQDVVMSSQLEFPGYSSGQVNAHIDMCDDEGLLQVEDGSDYGQANLLIRGLTAAGQRELSRLRREDSLLFRLRSVFPLFRR